MKPNNNLYQTVQDTLYDSYNRSANLAMAMPKAAFVCLISGVAISGLLPMDVLAALPATSEEVVPDAVTGTDAMTQGAQIGEMGVKFVCAFLGILAVAVPVAAMIKSFRNRKNGDNDDFNGTVIGGLILMVLGVGLSIVGFNYAAGVAAQVMALG